MEPISTSSCYNIKDIEIDTVFITQQEKRTQSQDIDKKSKKVFN